MTGEEEKRKRRARGEGGLSWDDRRQRWVAIKTVGYDGRGKRIVRKGSGKSQTAALRQLAQRVKDYESGLIKGSEHYRVGQAVEDWLDHGQGDNGQSTLARNRNLCESHIIPKLGGRKLRELTPNEVDTWLADLAPALATSTLRRVHSHLNNAVRRAMRRGLVDRNVVELCDVPRGREGRKSKSLTLSQAQDILTKTRTDPLYGYIVVSLLTGARTEELRALRWEHVHLDGDPGPSRPIPPHVEVWRSVRATGDTKTRKSRRTLALPAAAVTVLREHKQRQAEARLAATSWADSELVFPTLAGTEMDAANVRRALRRALTSVPGLDPKEWTPRELRHSFVSVLSDSGVSIEEISRLVGHQGTQVTELVYRHQLKPVIQTGATVMDTLFELPESEASADG
jgi:integrase